MSMKSVLCLHAQGNAFEPEQWRDQLQGAVGVVSCLGGFGSNDFMLKAGAITQVYYFSQDSLGPVGAINTCSGQVR